MNDPIRFLDAANDAMPHEKSLLMAGRDMQPPPGAQEKIWAALGPQIGPGGNGGGGGGDGGMSGNTFSQGSAGLNSSGASISGFVGGAKAITVGVVGFSAMAGVVAAIVALSPAAAPSRNVAMSAQVAPISVPLEEKPVVVEEPKEAPVVETKTDSPSSIIWGSGSPSAPFAPSPEPAPIATIAPQKSANHGVPHVPSAKLEEQPATALNDANAERLEKASRLREENRLLGDARAALRGGDPAVALEKLDAASGRFPDGVLAQEREVLAIEALAKSGRKADASARAAAFLAAHPTSPHATKVRAFIQ